MRSLNWAVIGRGVISLTSAYRLLKSGADVCVYGPASKHDSASAAAVGISTMKGLLLSEKQAFDAKLKGHNCLEQLISELDFEKDQSSKIVKGVFEFFSSHEERTRLQKRIYHHQLSDAFDFKILNQEESLSLSPLIRVLEKNTEISGSYFYPNDFSFNPDLHLQNLEYQIKKMGGKIIDSEVYSIVPSEINRDNELQNKPYFDIHLKKLIKAQVHNSVVQNKYDRVFLAAGIHTNSILKSSKIDEFPLSYSTGSSFKMKSLSIFKGVSGALKQGRDSFLVRDGELRFGSIEQKIEGNNHDQSRQNRLATRLTRLFNLKESQYSEVAEIKRTRVKTIDLFPIFGSYSPFVDKPGHKLWIATGFHKSGFFLSDYCARNIEPIENGKIVDRFFELACPSRFQPQ